jgi:hypothetical protein
MIKHHYLKKDYERVSIVRAQKSFYANLMIIIYVRVLLYKQITENVLVTL